MTKPKWNVVNVRLPDHVAEKLSKIAEEWERQHHTTPSLRQLIISLIMEKPLN